MYTCVAAQSLGRVQVASDSVTPWTVAQQAPLSVEFSRQEYWSRLSFSSLGHLPYPGIEPPFLASPALAGRFFITEAPGKPFIHTIDN